MFPIRLSVRHNLKIKSVLTKLDCVGYVLFKKLLTNAVDNWEAHLTERSKRVR